MEILQEIPYYDSRLTRKQSMKLAVVEGAMLLANKEAVMAVLDTLNFVAFKPLQSSNPITVCRQNWLQRLTKKSNLQIIKTKH